MAEQVAAMMGRRDPRHGDSSPNKNQARKEEAIGTALVWNYGTAAASTPKMAPHCLPLHRCSSRELADEDDERTTSPTPSSPPSPISPADSSSSLISLSGSSLTSRSTSPPLISPFVSPLVSPCEVGVEAAALDVSPTSEAQYLTAALDARVNLQYRRRTAIRLASYLSEEETDEQQRDLPWPVNNEDGGHHHHHHHHTHRSQNSPPVRHRPWKLSRERVASNSSSAGDEKPVHRSFTGQHREKERYPKASDEHARSSRFLAKTGHAESKCDMEEVRWKSSPILSLRQCTSLNDSYLLSFNCAGDDHSDPVRPTSVYDSNSEWLSSSPSAPGEQGFEGIGSFPKGGRDRSATDGTQKRPSGHQYEAVDMTKSSEGITLEAPRDERQGDTQERLKKRSNLLKKAFEEKYKRIRDGHSHKVRCQHCGIRSAQLNPSSSFIIVRCSSGRTRARRRREWLAA